MNRIFLLIVLFCLSFEWAYARPLVAPGADVCIYGGTSAGVIAAYTAAKSGKSVILIEPGNRLGGLSSGGLGFTDIGNKYVVTGLARDFYRHIGQYYGKLEQWTFEPKVANAVFLKYAKEKRITIYYNWRLNAVTKAGTVIKSIRLEQSQHPQAAKRSVVAKQFIDCSYEGDLMAKAGVSYTIGREDNSLYNETVSGVQLKNEHQFPDNIDPYKIPGDPKSGLLWGISNAKLEPNGTGDIKIQAYNFRICLSNDPANRIPITKPERYDPSRYELLLRYLAAKPSKDLWAFLKMSLMPNHKTDINNNGPFSTDMIGMNYKYPEGSYQTREAILTAHEDYTKGLLYFAGHDSRVPEHLRNQMLEWGYPKDEYLESGHFTKQLYVREARRMIGAYIMTQANCERKVVVPDGVGMGAYNMDSHNAQRLVVDGMVKNEGDVQLRGISPYPIAYRSITPKQSECSNLTVPVCLSASHMAYGSIRMEPVFMVLGQSSAVAACQAIDGRCAIQQIDVTKLQNELKTNPLADHSLAEVLIDNDDTQNVTVTGKWDREKIGGYGPSFLKASSAGSSAVKFSAAIAKPGKYQIYAYFSKVPNASDVTTVKIFNGNQLTTRNVKKDEIQIVGQASGEWVALGSADFQLKRRGYVEISTEGANGVVVADAVLFVPQKVKSNEHQ
ncbi:FAD-dependent oxidoreductase [Mucilaginibacter aquatilis]|uniref:FAD-dependent oxidoreductase n=1 Tax=Mucilaginibacter aquatilis TaxID=1517760 RepID=A0A6I4II64_9SPHI|nr:FAD-dependent oxidoreductase [Mucilaginibacter aquatilis]MVN92989.1 FAD-dependent oxidoreductase [Mucilaginibacter aquatilis]